MAKSPYSKRVRSAWERLFYAPNISREEREARSVDLYDSCLSNGEWIVNEYDAELVSGLASDIALGHGRFAQSVEICERFLRLPPVDEYHAQRFTGRLGASLILGGNWDEGLQRLREFLASIDGPMRLREHLNQDLDTICQGLGDAEPIDERFREFVVEFLEGWPGQSRRQKLVRAARNYFELRQIIAEAGRPASESKIQIEGVEGPPKRSQKVSFSKQVQREWDSLAFPSELAPDEREARALALYESCRPDGEWIVNFFDASSVTLLVSKLAMQSGRFEKSVEVCTQCLSHAAADWDDGATVNTCLGASLILCGKLEDGLARLHDSLAILHRDWSRIRMKEDLIGLFHELGLTNPVDPGIRAFAMEFLKNWQQQTVRRDLVRGARNYLELSLLIGRAGHPTDLIDIPSVDMSGPKPKWRAEVLTDYKDD